MSTPVNFNPAQLNNLICPERTLPDDLLTKIYNAKNNIILSLETSIVTNAKDMERLKQLKVVQDTQPLDERTQRFVAKMLKAIDHDINQKAFLKNWLEKTFPYFVHGQEIKNYINANLSNDPAVVNAPTVAEKMAIVNARVSAEFAHYFTPTNADKTALVYAQCLSPIRNFMATLDQESITQIIM